MVLAHLCRQLEADPVDQKDSETEPADETEIFRTAVAYHMTNNADEGKETQTHGSEEE